MESLSSNCKLDFIYMKSQIQDHSYPPQQATCS